ncbi:MAG: C39 family peptidase [Methanosarcinales archaeon]|nr:C39 family peptidase [Methanosarcinales archaeon]
MKRNKGMQIFAVLIVMLLLSMAFVPAVSANKRDESDLISIDQVKMYASFELNYFAFNTPGFEEWTDATIGEAILITDFNDQPVLYDVPIVKNRQNKGNIKIWAQKSMGVPIYSISNSPIESTQEANKAIETISRENNVQISSVKLIYHDFPKNSLKVTFIKDNEIEMEKIIDITTGDIISKDEIKSFESKVKKHNVKERTDLWKKVDKQINSNSGALITKGIIDSQSINQKTLDVPLIGQTSPVGCSPTSASMVLQYHGYDLWENEIADAMETDNFKGTYLENIPIGIEKVTNYQVDSWNDFWWTWSDLTTEINNDHPFLTSTTTHSRVVKGYKADSIFFWEKYMSINDPAPRWVGSTYWENYYSGVALNIAITLVH